jgi:hypothetical protein
MRLGQSREGEHRPDQHNNHPFHHPVAPSKEAVAVMSRLC